MHKNFMIGREEKHQVSFSVNWFLGYVHIALDGKTLARRPFFLKIDRTFEVGQNERHLVRIRFDIFDYFRNVFKVVVDGHDVTRQLSIKESEYHIDTPVDDAASALLFVAFINIMFSVIGTLFPPYLDGLETRLLLLVGALFYLLFFVKVMAGSRNALVASVVFFLADSALNFYEGFSAGGLVVRLVILYYLGTGIRYSFRRKLA